MLRLVHAKLLQRNIIDSDGELIGPWQTYDKLRAGTLVLMKVQLLTFEIADQRTEGSKKVGNEVHQLSTPISQLSQIYQFLTERLHVLAPSDDAIEPRENAKLSPNVSLGDPINAKRDEMDDAFDLVSFSKKQKVTHESESTASSPSSATATTFPSNQQLVCSFCLRRPAHSLPLIDPKSKKLVPKEKQRVEPKASKEKAKLRPRPPT